MQRLQVLDLPDVSAVVRRLKRQYADPQERQEVEDLVMDAVANVLAIVLAPMNGKQKVRDLDACIAVSARRAVAAGVNRLRRKVRNEVSLDSLVGQDAPEDGDGHDLIADPRTPSPETALVKAAVRSACLDAIDKLPQRQRLAYCLRSEEGLPRDQVGERLGCSGRQADRVLEDAVERLTRQLREYVTSD